LLLFSVVLLQPQSKMILKKDINGTFISLNILRY